ncbi:hypothetical protein F5141DRAFT_1222585 [Pisolithus sp. B1]|nr:hypothetical protein F5141DRAFT_1222585 [Pisolithus sp. B1]
MSHTLKVLAKWMEEEEHALVLYLQEHTPVAGDGFNFSKKDFNNACQHLKERFPNQHGGEKTSSTCLSKWTSVHNLGVCLCAAQGANGIPQLKEESFAVIDLKKASGFM